MENTAQSRTAINIGLQEKYSVVGEKEMVDPRGACSNSQSSHMST